MTTPIDIIANAIRMKLEYLPDRRVDELAAAIAGALTDDRIVNHAATALASALRDEGCTVMQWGEPAVLADFRDLARAVLRSVGA